MCIRDRLSSFDVSLQTGAHIPVEERRPEEITEWGNRRTAARGAAVFNPAFDVTPARLIAAIVTEAGVLRPPYRSSIRRAFEQSGNARLAPQRRSSQRAPEK